MLYEKKKSKIQEFYRELIEIPEVKDFAIKIEPQKFQHHSMCLNLSMVNHLYSFFKLHKDKFSNSR